MKNSLDLEPLIVAVGSSWKSASNWIERIELVRNFLQPTLPGQPRQFRHHEAVLLVTTAALVAGGAKPKMAAPIAAAIARAVKANGKPAREWLIYRGGNFKKGVHTDSTDAAEVAKQVGAGPLCFIPIGDIVRMVDRLWQEGA